MAGKIDIKEARQKVETAKSLLAEVNADDPDATQDRHRKMFKNTYSGDLSSSDPEIRRESGGKLLRIVALETFLSRWFRNQRPSEPPDHV